MNADEVLNKIDDAYLAFNLLSGNLESDLNKILSVQKDVDDFMIVCLIEKGESWREQIVGLILACNRDIKKFYNSFLFV